MLSLFKVGRGRWDYYLATVADGRGEAGGLVEPDGAWLGATAQALGLEDLPVDARRLGALLDGVDPATGERLDPSHDRVRIAGFDCTFAAPKSVSLVHALGEVDVVAQVRAAHEASVSAALGYLEHEAVRVRHRSGGADRVLPTTGAAAAAFVHRTSRAPDPHLHSHVLVANLGCDGSGRWTALDARPLFVHASTAGALYRAQLRDELVRRLDVAWRWREDGFAELAGVRPEVLRAFSRRHEAIVAGLAASGRTGARAARIVSTAARPEKDLTTPYEELVESWRDRAHAAGVSSGRLASLAAARPPERPFRAPIRPLRRLDVAEVTSRPFTRRDLVRARSQKLHDGGKVADVVASVDADLASGLASGVFVIDPERGRAVATFQHRSGARIPAGVSEQMLVSREFLLLEAAICRTVAASPEPGSGPLAPGCYALRGDGTRPLELIERLSAAVTQAVGDGRQVVAMARGQRRAAHLEAVTGLEVASSAPREMPADGGLIVVGDADGWDIARLAGLVDTAARSSTVLLVPSFLGKGRSALVEAFGLPEGTRAPSPPVLRADPLLQVCSKPDRSAAVPGRPRDVTVRLVARTGELVAALARESERQRAAHGTSLVVVGDRALAASLERSTGGALRAVAAADLRRALAGSHTPGLVVLGGSRLLGRAVANDTSLPRAHVAVAPPGSAPTEQERWAARLASTGPAQSRGGPAERVTAELAEQHRRDRGARGLTFGRDLGFGRG